MIVATATVLGLDPGKWNEVLVASIDTLLMLAGSLPLTLALGLPLGVFLFLSSKAQRLTIPGCTTCWPCWSIWCARRLSSS